MNILVINGPNLNLLGTREPSIYQNNTYSELENFLYDLSQKTNTNIVIKQTNHEGMIIDYLHQAIIDKIDGIIINPGAYTHYSYAIYDAIKAINIQTVEVHLTDIRKRETWRQVSVTSSACQKVFMGEHFLSYQKAFEYLLNERK